MPSRRRWWLVVTLLVCAGLFAGLATWPPASPAGGSVGPSDTALWSVRRVPGVVVDPVNAANETAAAAGLQARLDAEADRFGGACFLVQRGTRVLASRAARMPFIPASTQKLFVAAAALEELGSDHRFETRAVTDGSGPVVDRVWVVGGGDPVVRTAEFVDAGISTSLDTLADRIAASGVRTIGSLLADDSRYDAQRYVPTWRLSYLSGLDVGPIGALIVDQGVTLATGRPTLVEDPAVETVDRLAGLLRARGIAVGRTGRDVAPPDAPTLASQPSEPLRAIVGYMLGVSDNVTAEMLTKELGLRLRGEGSTAAGVAAVRDVLTRLGIDVGAVETRDGSGLDRGNRTTCAALVAVLQLADRPELRDLHDAIPGSDDAIRAKSGYLEDVTGLAGTMDRAGLTFAILLNGGVPEPAGPDLRRFAEVLVSYDPPPPLADTAVPLPAEG